MKNEFVPYDIALDMKGIGFDEDCFGRYVKEKLGWTAYALYHYDESDWVVNAPLYQQAFRWFREKHDKQSWIHKPAFGKFYFVIENKGGRFNYNTYEEAELECLRKLIEIVKDEK